MNLTIAEIARMAGVSKATVSRVLNDKPDVLPKTRDRIRALMAQYDFQPNAYAKAVANRRSQTIGLVIAQDPDTVLANPYYAEIIRGVSQEARLNHYHLLLTYAAGGDYDEAVRQKRVDGLILISPAARDHALVDRLDALEMPFVATSRLPGRPDIRYVCNDDRDGARQAVSHLTALGHRIIGFINGSEVLASSEDRMTGYHDALAAAGLPPRPDLVCSCDTSIASGHAGMQTLLQREPGLTAVFVASDLMAVGAVRALEEAGRHVPADCSVVGFDDIPLAGFLHPPLTTVHQEIFAKGQTAARLLLDRLAGRDAPDQLTLPCQLVVRQSTGPPRPKVSISTTIDMSETRTDE